MPGKGLAYTQFIEIFTYIFPIKIYFETLCLDILLKLLPGLHCDHCWFDRIYEYFDDSIKKAIIEWIYVMILWDVDVKYLTEHMSVSNL